MHGASLLNVVLAGDFDCVRRP
ncbi:hypothetical protein ACNFZ3_01355 [Escherichia coli]